MENNRLNQRVFKIIVPIVAITFFVGLGAGIDILHTWIPRQTLL